MTSEPQPFPPSQQRWQSGGTWVFSSSAAAASRLTPSSWKAAPSRDLGEGAGRGPGDPQGDQAASSVQRFLICLLPSLPSHCLLNAGHPA